MSRGCVLVLDRNPHQAQHVSQLLADEKWASMLSFDRDATFRLLKHRQFQLLLLDAYTGDANIVSELPQIRAVAQDAPVAIMSDGGHKGHALDQTMNMARRAGADFIMPKPFQPGALKTLLSETSAYHRERALQRHVLIVEPDDYLRKEIAAVLTQVGYAVSTAVNMEDAFFDHNLGLVDIVMTAILIPGIGGIEGIAQIRRDFPHVRIIAMSQGVDDKVGAMHVLAAAKTVGAEVLLPKPFIMPDVLRSVMSLVAPKDETLNDDAAQAAIDAIFAH